MENYSANCKLDFLNQYVFFMAVVLMALFPKSASASQEAQSNRAPSVIYDKQTYIRDHVCYRFHINGTADVVAYDLYYPEYTKEEFYQGNVVIPSTVYFDDTKSFTVTTIANSAFMRQNGLESVTLPPTVTKIGAYAFGYNEKLTAINFSEGVTEIGERAFAGCVSLTSVEFPNSIQTIGDEVFDGCTNLAHVKFGSGMTSIGSAIFANCSGLSSVEVDPANAKYDSGNSSNAVIEKSTNTLVAGCKTSVIPQGVEIIGANAFKNCEGLTSIEIPSSVKEIQYRAFCECVNLKTVKMTNGLENISTYVFENCTSLETLEFPSTVNVIWSNCVYGANNLVSITLNPGIKTIMRRAFVNCGIKSFVIPNTVEEVQEEAFGWCGALEQLVVPESVKTFDYEAVTHTKIASYPTFIWKDVNQTSVTVTVDEEATAFFYKGKRYDGSELKIDNLNPGGLIEIAHGELSYLDKNRNLKLISGSHGRSTRNIEPRIRVKDGYSLSSAEVTFSHVDGDAYIQRREYKINGTACQITSDPHTIILTDLDPETTIEYTLTVNGKLYSATRKLDIPLTLETQSAKAVSNTSALISCKTSLGDDCSRAGFEWRRVDAPDIVESSKVACAIINGEMLGTLHNLSSNTYYKYRPYYQAMSGNYYFGEWKGFGTADAYVYFEPIARTSQASQITETTALLAGNSVAGSDKITKQGFEYGEYVADAKMAALKTVSTSGNGKQIEAPGTNMQVMVENLQPGTDYWFRVFVTTASGTTYGETLFFKTEGDKTDSVKEIETDGKTAIEVARYDLRGNKVSRNYHGIYVVVMSDGKVFKVSSAQGR